MLIFPLWDFIVAFRNFLLYTGSLSNSFLRLLLNFLQISLYFSNNLSSFIKKNTYLVSSKSLLYALLFGINISKSLIFFHIFVAKKIFKYFFTKRDLIRFYYFINIYIFIKIGPVYWWNFCFWVSIPPNFIIVFSIFTYPFKKFYICLNLLFSTFFIMFHFFGQIDILH